MKKYMPMARMHGMQAMTYARCGLIIEYRLFRPVTVRGDGPGNVELRP